MVVATFDGLAPGHPEGSGGLHEFQLPDRRWVRLHEAECHEVRFTPADPTQLELTFVVANSSGPAELPVDTRIQIVFTDAIVLQWDTEPFDPDWDGPLQGEVMLLDWDGADRFSLQLYSVSVLWQADHVQVRANHSR